MGRDTEARRIEIWFMCRRDNKTVSDFYSPEDSLPPPCPECGEEMVLMYLPAGFNVPEPWPDIIKQLMLRVVKHDRGEEKKT